MKIDQIIRSNRKTIALIVQKDGSLVVRAPLRTSRSKIESLVKQKEGWIRAKQEQARQIRQEIPTKHFSNGEMFLYLGQEYPLEILENPPHPLTLDGKFYLARSAQPGAAAVFERWYRAQARQVLTERVDRQAKQYGLKYRSVRITGARTRWGSCGAEGDLNFTWRLVKAPLEVIDYVVAHELAHLVERNHSSRFWEEMAWMMPNYKQQVAWLKNNSNRLSVI
jgi:predicted metal-dependent hydrolase